MDLGLTMDYYRGVGFIFYSGLLQRSKIQGGRILSLGPEIYYELQRWEGFKIY